MLDEGFLNAPHYTRSDFEREKSKMTDEEKKNLKDDVYGCKKPRDSFPSQHIQEIRDEIAKFDDDDKRNYLEAMRRGADVFTSDDRDLVLFLKKDEYDVKAAADRLIAYWDRRVAIFGEEAAFKPLSMETLPVYEEDRDHLPIPYVSPLPEKDAHARHVVFNDMSLKKKIDIGIDSLMRLWWCAFHVVLRDRENPTHGDVVLVGTGGGALTRRYQRKPCYMFFATMGFLPVKMVGFHFCNPPAMVEMILPFILFIAGRQIRTRFHLHTGTENEVLLRLEEFGLTKQILPMRLGGDSAIYRTDPKRKRSLSLNT